MRRFLIAILVVVLSAGAAFASGYSELNLGFAYRLREDWTQAILHFTAALAAPDLPAAYRSTAYADRGDSYLMTKQLDKAIADYSAAIAADPDFLAAYRSRAFAYTLHGNIDGAISDFSAIIARRPSLGGAYGARGAAYAIQNRMDLALADFNTYVQIEPSAVAPYMFRGAARRELHQFDAAIEDFSKAIDIKDDAGPAYVERGETYRDLGNYSAAERDMEHAIRMAPNDVALERDLAITQWDAGDFRAASATLLQMPLGKADNGYMALWRYIAQASNGTRDDTGMQRDAGSIDLSKWPGPVIKVYLGQIAPDAALAAAANVDTQTQNNQICEADFYLAEWQILHGNKTAALPLLQGAQNVCPAEYIERAAAAAELKRQQ